MASKSTYSNPGDVSEMSVSQRKFARDLYMKLASSSTDNIFFSPFSITTALGMVYAGARGNTKEEMRKVMSLAQEDEALHGAFKNVIADFKGKHEDFELSTSNKTYISDQLTVFIEYLTLLTEMYHSSAKTVNFAESEQVRKEINDAVERDTNLRIKDLIPKDVLDTDTRMVLVNAVYFKGLWKNQFEKSATRNADFWTSESESITVPMMFIKEHFDIGYNQELGATILSLDYKGSRLSMVIVLPSKRDGLSEMEDMILNMNFSDLEKDLHTREIELFLPKFKLSETIKLNEPLEDMGIRDMFNPVSCDLSGISEDEMYASHVFHKSFLEVDEKGTEAAAATGIVLQIECVSMPEQVFVDHPFMFYIRDLRSGLILFIGRLTKPEEVSYEEYSFLATLVSPIS